MSLDLATLKALAGEASVSLGSARRYLDETGACADDLEDASLKGLWAVLEDRIRRGVGLDAHAISASLKATSCATGVVFEVINECELGFTQQRLEAFREKGVLRRFENAARDAVRAGRNGAPVSEVHAMAARAQSMLDGGKSRVRSAVGDAAAIRDHLEAVYSGKRPPALRTGFEALDEALGGLINSLIAIGAHPGVGKSALVAGLVRNWAMAGVPIGLLAYEDDARDMAARIVAADCGVSVRHTRGDIIPNEAQKALIHDGLARWAPHEAMLFIDDARPTGSLADVLASMRTMVARGARVVILDNMKCVRMDAGDEMHQMVADALQAIRELAQSLRVPAIVIGHLKRGQSDVDESRRPPKMSDFSNSSAWEVYARVAIGMWRDGSDVAAKVLKQTNGPINDEMTLVFQKEAAVVVAIESRQPMAPRESAGRKKYTPHQPEATDE